MDNAVDSMRALGRGSFWMVLTRLIEKTMGLVSSLILAALLAPDHFGIVAIASGIVAALELMGAFSFDTLLIQKKDTTNDDYNTVWTIGIVLNGFYALVLLSTASFIADFYRDDRLRYALVVLAFVRVISSFSNIGVIEFRKNLMFRQDFSYALYKKLVTTLVTICAALVLLDYRALLFGLIIGAIYGCALSYLRHQYRPSFSLSKAREMMGGSFWLFVHNIVYFLNARYADFFIGKFAGMGAVGVFNLASEIATIPLNEVAAPINKASFPIYAKLKVDDGGLKKLYGGTFETLAILVLPAAAGIAAISDVFIDSFFGVGWEAAKQVLPILAFAMIPTAITNNNGVVLLAMGSMRANALLTTSRTVLLLACISLFGWLNGLVGVAQAFMVSNFIVAPVSQLFLAKAIGFGPMDILRALLKPCLATMVMYGGVKGAVELVPMTGVFALAFYVVLGAVLYCLASLLLWILSGRPDSFVSSVVALVVGFVRRKKVE